MKPTTIKTKNRILLEKLAVAIVMMAVVATKDGALAQATGGTGAVFQPLNNVFSSVLSFMTGTFATTAATIAVCAVGYLALTSRIPWSWCFSIVCGVAFIFGGSQLVTSISSGIGSSSQ